MVRAGLRLHDFVIDATSSMLLRRAYDTSRNQAIFVRSFTQRVFAIEQASFRDHLRILEAIHTRQSKAAEAAMRDHLSSTRERMLKQLFR
jgi:DNA-binding GntR family transcriptional regulator